MESSDLHNAQVPLLNDEDLALLKKRNKISLTGLSSILVISLGCCGFLEYSMVMPVMSHYVETLGGSSMFYGVSMAAFSAARVLFMPVLGIWADKGRMIWPFLFSVVLSAVGNLLYGLASYADSKWFVLIGRVLVGMGAANSTLTMSYITRITTRENRTKALATINGINLLGIVLGPVLNTMINFRKSFGDFEFNEYANPGYLMFLIMMVILVMMAFAFEEPDRYGHGAVAQDEFDDVEEEQHDEENQVVDDTPPAKSPMAIFLRMMYRDSLWVHFVVSFSSNFILAELETALPDLTRKSYGWNTIQNSFMYAIIGLVTASALILTGVYSGRISDRKFIGAGTLIYGIGLILGCFTLDSDSPPMAFFVICCLLLIVAAPLTDSPNLGFYSKRLSDRADALPYLGLYLGMIDASNGVSRVVGPLYAGWALDQKDHLPTYLGPTCVWAVAAITFVVKYAKFKDLKDHKRRATSIQESLMESVATPYLQSPMFVHTPLVEGTPAAFE